MTPPSGPRTRAAVIVLVMLVPAFLAVPGPGSAEPAAASSLARGVALADAFWDPLTRAAYVVGGSTTNVVSSCVATIQKYVPGSAATTLAVQMPRASCHAALAFDGRTAALFGNHRVMGFVPVGESSGDLSHSAYGAQNAAAVHVAPYTYILGGSDASMHLVKLWDPLTGSLTQRALLPDGLGRVGAVGVTDGVLVYLLGGGRPAGAALAALVYEPTTGTAREATAGAALTGWHQGAGAWARGFGWFFGSEQRVYRWSPGLGYEDMGTWSTANTYGATAAANGDVVYVFGGFVDGVASRSVTHYPTRLVPSVPLAASATPADGAVEVAWSPPIGDGGYPVDAYRVHRSVDSGELQLAAQLPASARTFRDEGLPNGATVAYSVQAVNAEGEGPGASSSATVGTPTAPRGVAAVPADATVVLAWQEPSDAGAAPVDGYRVLRGPSCADLSHVATAAAEAREQVDAGLENGVAYCYALEATNAHGVGLRSATATATPRTVPSVPLQPSAAPGNRTVTLAWKAPTWDGGAPVTAYKVLRDEVLLATLEASTRSFTDAGLTNGVAHVYGVLAHNDAGDGPAARATATPRGVPFPPRNVRAEPHERSTNLSWSAPVDDGGSPVVNYRVFRSSDDGMTFWEVIGSPSWQRYQVYTDLDNGRNYCWRVAAVTAAGTGTWSAYDCAIANAVPSPPRFTAAQDQDGKDVVRWTASEWPGDAPILDYVVCWGVAKGAETQCDEANALSAGASTYTYQTTPPTTAMSSWYVVKARNAFGSSPPGASVEVRRGPL